MEEGCQISSINNDLAKMSNLFTTAINSVTSVIKAWKDLMKSIDELEKIVIHLHNCHLHMYMPSHGVTDYPGKGGIYAGCDSITCVDRMAYEVMTTRDADDNGMIYGDDFTLKDDGNAPRIIKDIHCQYEARYEALKGALKSFAGYLATVNTNQRTNPTNTTSKLMAQMVLKDNMNNPKSSLSTLTADQVKKSNPLDSKVYGQDYIIDPKDPDKPKDLIPFEKEIGVNPDAKKIKYQEYLRQSGEEFAISTDVQLTGIGVLSTLMFLEYYKGSDYDGNNEQFGIDFILETPPGQLQQLLSENSKIMPSNKLPTKTLTEYVKGCIDSLNQPDLADNITFELNADSYLSARLTAEFIQNKDLDGDGFIYGIDYMIDPRDTYKPSELKSLEQKYNIQFTENTNIKTYNDYLKSCTGISGTSLLSSVMRQVDYGISEASDYVITRLVAEWVHNTDIDGNGLIYGHDFKLCSHDAKKHHALYEIERDYEWTDPKDSLTWEQFCRTFPNNNPDDRKIHENK